MHLRLPAHGSKLIRQRSFAALGALRRQLGYLTAAPQASFDTQRRTVVLTAGGLAFAKPQRTKESTLHEPGSTSSMSKEDLQKAVRSIVPGLTGDRAKGQAGRIATIGGCREYTGAPYFAAFSALKIGADLSHVFCTEGAATVIKSYSPELIVHPYLADSHDLPDQQGPDKVAEAVDLMIHWMERFDAVIIGPGLGRDSLVHETVKQVLQKLREKQKPVIIDADGLFIVSHNLELIRGYTSAILTPNKHEFERLAGTLHISLEGAGAPEDPLLEVTRRLEGPIVLRKGKEDQISDGATVIRNAESGSKRRAGGQGDVLSGAVAVMVAWALERASEAGGDGITADGISPLMIAAYGGSQVARHAQKAAFDKHRRSMLAEDVIMELGATVDFLFDHDQQ